MIRPRFSFLPQGSIAGGALPWVLAVMVFLCALAAGFGLTLDSAISDWAGSLSRQISVQIVSTDQEDRERQAAAALDILKDTPGIKAVRRIDDNETTALLEPWLGKGNVTPDLPIPILLDVELQPGFTMNLTALGARLSNDAPDAALDDHERWLVALDRLAKSLQIVSGLVITLILAATAAIAAFGTRAVLASHRETIEIMHWMGAEDRTIAGEFRYQFMLQGMKGGLFGLIMGVLVLFVIDYFADQLGHGLIPQLNPGIHGWLAILILPVFAAILTMTAAHLTVRRELSRMP